MDLHRSSFRLRFNARGSCLRHLVHHVGAGAGHQAADIIVRTLLLLHVARRLRMHNVFVCIAEVTILNAIVGILANLLLCFEAGLAASELLTLTAVARSGLVVRLS